VGTAAIRNGDWTDTPLAATGDADTLYAAYENFQVWRAMFEATPAFFNVINNLATASQADMTAFMGQLEFERGNLARRQSVNGHSMAGLDQVSARNDATINRLDTAIGALSDADLGQASAARAQAETRQQLAIGTVRQAISAYEGFASGLLGNVQRTQRGVMA
jgi:flagellin-like hook-associated protein FlgL